MKDLFKKIVKPLLIISFVLLFSCEKDLYEEHIKKPNRGETTLLTGIEAEKVSQRLKKLLGTQSSISDGGYTKTFSLNLGTISYDEILKVIDAMGKENYSFKVERPESSDSKFYNVVLQEEDETTVIKLIEFSMDSDFADDFKVNQDLLKFKGTIKFTPVYNDSPCPEPEVIIQIGDIPSQHYQTGGGGSTNNEHNTSSPIVTGNGGHGNGLSLLLLLTHSGGSSNTTTTSNIGAGNYTCPPNFHYDPKVHDCMPDARVDKMEVGPTVLIEGDPTVPPAEPVDPCAHNTEIGILLPFDKCTQSFLVGLDPASKQWLYARINNNDNIYIQLMEYISKSSNCEEANNFVKELVNSAAQNEIPTSAVPAILNYLHTNDNSDISKTIVRKWLELKKELKINPNLLLNIPCSEIPKWQALVQFHPPQSIKDKIQTLDDQHRFSDYEIQYLDNANGTVINLDYFPITINALPNIPGTGQQFTPGQFLHYVRTHINNFVNTDISEFSPTTLVTGYDESAIWDSSNPLGAIIHINIPAYGSQLSPGDGSVICSETNSNHWIFTTVEVPYGAYQGQDGQHPVSGNRQFGLISNSDGTYTFYTRGADRMTSGFDQTIVNLFINNPFENSDALWNSFRTKIFNFVQTQGGSAESIPSSDNKIWRPDWDKVRHVLHGEESITVLGCN